MKRIVAMFLMCVLCVSLCACGESGNYKEVSYKKISEEYAENLKKAENNHIGKHYKLYLKVEQIQQDYVVLSPDVSGVKFHAEFSKQDIELLKKDEWINVTGQIGKCDIVSGQNIFINLKKAKYIDNIIEFKGKINFIGSNEVYGVTLGYYASCYNFSHGCYHKVDLGAFYPIYKEGDSIHVKGIKKYDTIYLEGNN